VVRGDSSVLPTNFIAAIGADPGNPTFGALWLEPGTAPTSSNFTIRQGPNSLAINDASGNSISFDIGGSQVFLTNTALTQFLLPIAGSSSNPLTLGKTTTSISVATATYTLNSTQYQNPIMSLTGTAAGGGCVIIVPNTIGAIWYFDFSAATLTGNVTFTTSSGTTTAVVSSTIITSGKLITVCVTSSHVVSATG
jgi:hypothetical protein